MSLSVFAAAAEAPERDAVVLGERRLTWRELGGLVRQRLDELRAAGVPVDSSRPIAIVAGIDLGTLVTLHTAIATGTPVHLLHPRLTSAERETLLERIAPAALVQEDGSIEIADHAEGAGAGLVAHADGNEALLAVVYTSGSTGAPKGVMLSRRAFTAASAASEERLGWREDDRWLLRIPLAHVGGLSIVTRCLLARRCVVLPDPDADPVRSMCDQIGRDRVTLVSLVPTLLRRMLDLQPGWDAPGHLRAMLLGGAAAPPALLSRAVAREWPVLTTYGLTEMCSQVATQRPGTVNRGELGAGPPLRGVEVRVQDGELLVRGPAAFSGYHPPASRPDPRLPDGWLATGDRGRIDAAGNVHVLGRMDDVIVSGGENVDPLEVENAIREEPGVADVCVFGVADERWGQRVCAALVPVRAGALDPATVDRALRERLAGFKRPRAYALLEAIPTLPSGKVDRRAAAAAASPWLRAAPQTES